MKRRFERFIPCLLCAALLVFLFAVPVNAAETSGTCGEDATWTLVDGVLTISGTGKTWDFRDDDSRFDYHPCPWEEVKDEIREVIVEEGITYLGASAFMECASLERVSLPESLTVLESFAISYCRQLSECELPSHLEYLGQENFKWSAIKHATIPASVTFLDGGVYTCCRQLESVYIEGDPDLQGFICGPGSFTACPALSAIEVSEDHIALCSVDGVLFNKKCTTLYAYPEGHKGSSYRIPTGTTEIFQSAFDFDRSVDVEHPEIELLIVPASVTDILGIFNDFRRIGAVRFEGDAPTGVEDALKIGSTYEEQMTVYYPKDNPTWAEVIAKAEGDEKFTWVAEESLAITAQPKSVTAAPGDSVEFTVTASGTDLSYQWQYSADGGNTWKDSPAEGNQTATLTVPATASRSGNMYRCVVRSGSSEVTSDAATLTVKEETPVPAAPEITAQPKSVTVTAGGSVNFTVAASGDDLSYQWEVSADGGKTWKDSPVTGNQTATLTVPATASRSGNQYRCVVKSGSAEVTSDAATLTVKSGEGSVPVLISAKATSGQITVKWNEVEGASKYAVYRKTGDSAWELIKKDVANTSYTDKSNALKPGTKYFYTVAACIDDVYGKYDKTGVSAKAAALTSKTVTKKIDNYYNAVTNKGKKKAYWNNEKGTKKLKEQADQEQYAKAVRGEPCKLYDNKTTPRKGEYNHNASHSDMKRTDYCQSNSFSGVGDAWTKYMAGIRKAYKAARVEAGTNWGYSGGGIQCSGFADYMLYVIFGSTSRNDFYYAENYNSIFTKDYTFQPGDLIRLNGHSMVVYEVSGNNVYIIECNYGKNCWIRCDRKESAESLRKAITKESTKNNEKNYILIPKAKLRSGDNASNAKVPGVVSAVTVKATTGKIKLTWAEAENAKVYKIRRKEKVGDAWGAWTTLIFDVDGTTYTDMTVVAGKQYQYEVRGANGEEYGSYTLSVGVKAK